MKIRFNPFLLGAFIVGGIAIAIALLLGLGNISFLHASARFVFYVPHSVQGINTGAAVNMAGVKVGQVEKIRIYYNPNAHNLFAGIVCRIDKNLLRDLRGRPIKLTDKQTLARLISQGLYARVEASGIVGPKYVELGFNPSSKPATFANLPSSPYPVVSSVPSTMSQLTGNISDIVSNLKQIDFQGMMKQVNGVLVAARGQINELQTNRLADHLSTAAQSVGDFMNSSDLRAAVNRLQGAASTFQSLVTNLNAQILPAGTNLNATLNSARESAESLQDFLKLRNQLGEQTYELMDQLNETARSIEQLSDFLQQHPNALISGRAKQTIKP